MEADKEVLKKLGFIVVYEKEERHTMRTIFSDGIGLPYIRKVEEITNGTYYKDIYFIHPEKSICIAMEYILSNGKYNIRTDVTGYMEIKKEQCIEDIKKDIFPDWAIKILDDQNIGIPIFHSNFEHTFKYLQEDKINNLTHPLPPDKLILEIEFFNTGIHINRKIEEYCYDLISHMDVPTQRYFNCQTEGYQKKK